MFILFFCCLENFYKLHQPLLKSFGILKSFKISQKKLTNKSLLKSWVNVVKLPNLKIGKSYGLISIKEKELSVFKVLLTYGKNTTFNEST